MLDQKGELEYFEQEDVEEISQLASMETPGDEAPKRKSSPVVEEKPGYPDSVYIMAANIFQSIRIEKSPEKTLIKYRNEPLEVQSKSEDESFRHLSYELAFSALKCE